MNSIATKFKVTSAAVAVGTSAAFAPVAANALPELPVPAAPSHQIIGNLAEQGPLTNFIYFIEASTIQAGAFIIRVNSAIQLARRDFWAQVAADNPGTFIGDIALFIAGQATEFLNNLGAVTAEAGNGTVCTRMGAYGAVTVGAC